MRRFSKLVTTGPAAGEGAMEEKEEEKTLGKGGRVAVVVGREREEDEMTRCDEDEAAVFSATGAAAAARRLEDYLTRGIRALTRLGRPFERKDGRWARRLDVGGERKMCKVSRG